MRKLLFLLPVAASALFLTGCNEVAYRERTVVHSGGPAYYGGAYDDDVYYVSNRPYSRTYGQLYLRNGRHYYSRGGNYVVYNRSVTRNRYVDRDRGGRRDWDDRRERVEDRRDDRRERIQDRREDRRDRVEDLRDRRNDRVDRVRTQQYRQQAQFQQARMDVRGPRVNERRDVEVNRNVRVNRVERGGERRTPAERAERREKRQEKRED